MSKRVAQVEKSLEVHHTVSIQQLLYQMLGHIEDSMKHVEGWMKQHLGRSYYTVAWHGTAWNTAPAQHS